MNGRLESLPHIREPADLDFFNSPFRQRVGAKSAGHMTMYSVFSANT